MVSWYVAHVFSEWYGNGSSRSNYYWYHPGFYIPQALYFYCEVFIFIIIITTTTTTTTTFPCFRYMMFYHNIYALHHRLFHRFFLFHKSKRYFQILQCCCLIRYAVLYTVRSISFRTNFFLNIITRATYRPTHLPSDINQHPFTRRVSFVYRQQCASYNCLVKSVIFLRHGWQKWTE